MRCKAAMKVLEDAQHRRDAARLCEVKISEEALYDVEHCYSTFYDWAAVRRATRAVRCWEARCDGAEVALAECLKRRA